MGTVSYLTINDETKEIADIVSRNNIEDIAATIAAHGTDLEQMQLEMGPDGTFSNSIDRAYLTALSAQTSAAVASEAAAVADAKAVSAGEAAELA